MPPNSDEPWRGYVCVPLSPDEDLGAALAGPDWRSKFEIGVVEDADFTSLREAGFWEALRASCGVLPDRYEEDWVEPSELDSLIACAESFLGGAARPPEITRVLTRLKELGLAALQRKVPLIFSF